MVKAQGEARKAPYTQVHITHGAVCDLKAVSAELSKEAGKMLTYEETILELIRRHKDHKGVA